MSKKKKKARQLDGERSSIRPIRISDATTKYVRWLNDKEVNRYLESRFSRTTLAGLRAYIRKVIEDPDTYMFAIADKETGKHIGTVKLGPIYWHHRFAEVGFMIGDKDFWGKGMASEAVLLLEQFAFRDLNLRRLTAGAYGNNIGSLKLLEKCGFAQEGVMKEQCFSDGKYVDGIRFGKLRKEVR